MIASRSYYIEQGYNIATVWGNDYLCLIDGYQMFITEWDLFFMILSGQKWAIESGNTIRPIM